MIDQPLRILHLEDDPMDAELISAALAADGIVCECSRTATQAGFVSALEMPWDLILSDYSLPGFDGISAQRLAAERRPEIPFVFVSGTMGEDVAIERLKAGATDYVLKHRLARLPAAVRRALLEARNKEERKRATAEVRRLNAELEARVVQRTAELAAANEELARREMELEKAKSFLDSIVENLPAMLFVKDARDRRFVRLNRAGEELLGIDRRELLGRTDHDLFPAPLANHFTQVDSDVLQGRTPVSTGDEVIATRRRGARILHTKKIPITGADGRPEYLLGIALDVTERRHAEEEARLAKLEADRANRAKSQFLSRMSHDLRTPLNAILGFAQLLESAGDLSDEQNDSVRQIRRGGEHLLELISDILDFARIEAGQLSLSVESLNVADVLREVFALVRPLADARRICLQHAPGVERAHVRADRRRFKQILMNLVGNAVKYNHDEGSVTVSAEQTPRGIRIRISDTGPGIALAERALLFQPFERLSADQRGIEGTGLGLSVAKGLLESMQGAIGIEAATAGATFWVELPEAAAEKTNVPTRRAQPAVDPTLHGSGTVLYIEDNRSNIRLLERLLGRRPGVHLISSETAAEGLRRAAQDRPGLVFLDLHLPDLGGEQVLERLRSDEGTRQIPVVVLSADATHAQTERLLNAGANGYLTKPLVLPAVLAMIDQHLAPHTTTSHGEHS